MFASSGGLYTDHGKVTKSTAYHICRMDQVSVD